MAEDRVADLAAEFVAAKRAAEPTEALLMGGVEYAGLHERASRDAEDERIDRFQAITARAASLRATTLTPDDLLTLDVIEHGAGAVLAEASSRMAEFDVNHVVGFQAFLPSIISMLPTQNRDVAAALPEKYRAMAHSIDERAQRLREGVAHGRTPPEREVTATAEQIASTFGGPFADDPLLRLPKPEDRPDKEWTAWLEAEIAPVVAREVRPALERYRQTLISEVLPHARSDDHIGLRWLADGADVHQAAIRRFTTLDLAADEIHDIGLEAVGRIRDEMGRLGDEEFGMADVAQVVVKLRTDDTLRYASAGAIVHDAERAIENATSVAPAWFGAIPKASCTVEVTSSGPDGWYMPPAPDGSRPGTFHLNVAQPKNFGPELEAVAYHETIPGHHLQVGVAQENPDLSDVRRNAEITAFAEGWGLYAEQLADEMGLYSSPLTRLGRLIVDALRAARLVVDTGIHAKGWSRSEALQYLVATVPFATDALEAQLDRYVGQPGQSLAYQLGRREILRIRERATSILGRGFRVADFHDVVLTGGSLPLPSLGRVVEAWAEAAATRA